MDLKLHGREVFIDQTAAKHAIHVLGLISKAGGPKSVFASLTGDYYSATGHAMAVAMAQTVLETHNLTHLLEEQKQPTLLARAEPKHDASDCREFESVTNKGDTNELF